MSTLIDRYSFNADYIPDYPSFISQVMAKMIIPYQVELQPGPVKGNICWLKCPYCYGRSAEDTGERLPRERWVEILEEIADGGVKKVIFAGYCTDPLNYEYIEDLVEVAIKRGMVFGFNTKGITISNRLVKLLMEGDIISPSYFNVSVDAGSNESYNRIHNMKGRIKMYNRVLRNTSDICWSSLDVSVSYLVMSENNGNEEIYRFVNDFRIAGCNLIRFTFLQPPRGSAVAMPSRVECDGYLKRLLPLIKELDSPQCRVIFVDADQEYGIYYRARTLPCLARWVYPTVGFDGWLYHCSQSAAPNFRKMALGNLAEKGFWETFYDYDLSRMTRDEKVMGEVGCRCDRKEHLVNGRGK